MKFTPHKYQRQIIDFIKENEKAFVIVPTGYGKTGCTLKALDELKDARPILIIGPLTVVKNVWPSQIEKFDFKFSFVNLSGATKKKREDGLEKDVDITLINVENVKWLVDNLKTFKFKTLIIDESTIFKNPVKSVRFKAIRKTLKHFDRIILLTATPITKSLFDLWSQAFILDRGKRLTTSFYTFRHKYFYQLPYKKYDWFEHKGARKAVFDKISDISIVLDKNKEVDIPELVDDSIDFDFSLKIQKQYAAFKRSLVLDIENGDRINSLNAAILSNKLEQFVGGFVYDEDKSPRHIHNEKLDVFHEYVESLGGEPALVVYKYKYEIEMIRNTCDDVVIFDKTKTNQIIEDWNHERIKLLLVHPGQVQYGLNLQDGGRYLIWYSLPWNPATYQQLTARLHRQGQKRAVISKSLLAKKTIDKVKQSALQERKTLQEALIEHLKGG